MTPEEYPPAHTPRPSTDGVRPALVNVDSTGVSMSWRTFWWSLGIVAASIASVYAFAQTIVFRADLDSHDGDDKAHPVLLEGALEREPTNDIVRRHERALRQLPTIEATLRSQDATLADIKAAMYEDRAEELADTAVKRIPLRAREETWKHVRKTAIENQHAGRPIRTGLEPYFR